MVELGEGEWGDEAVKTWPSHFILMFAHIAIIDLSLFSSVGTQTWQVA